MLLPALGPTIQAKPDCCPTCDGRRVTKNGVRKNTRRHTSNLLVQGLRPALFIPRRPEGRQVSAADNRASALLTQSWPHAGTDGPPHRRRIPRCRATPQRFPSGFRAINGEDRNSGEKTPEGTTCRVPTAELAEGAPSPGGQNSETGVSRCPNPSESSSGFDLSCQ